MKAKQIQEVVTANSLCKIETLQSAIKSLSEICEERGLTKKMYFWSPSKKAYERRTNEEKRNISIDILLKGIKIHYYRNYKESCHHVYAFDRLWSDEYENFTSRDISKIIEGLQEIIKKRSSEA